MTHATSKPSTFRWRCSLGAPISLVCFSSSTRWFRPWHPCKIGDQPSKMTQKRPKLGVGVLLWSGKPSFPYSRVPGHRNWQIETAVWNLAGFLHCALGTRLQRFGQFLNDFLNDFLDDFLYGNLTFSMKNLIFTLKILWKSEIFI